MGEGGAGGKGGKGGGGDGAAIVRLSIDTVGALNRATPVPLCTCTNH